MNEEHELLVEAKSGEAWLVQRIKFMHWRVYHLDRMNKATDIPWAFSFKRTALRYAHDEKKRANRIYAAQAIARAWRNDD